MAAVYHNNRQNPADVQREQEMIAQALAHEQQQQQYGLNNQASHGQIQIQMGQPYQPEVYQQQSPAYPVQVPADVRAQIEAHDKAMNAETANSILACIPGLRKDRDRQGFVIKVYSIIICMLLVTTAICAFFYTNESAKKFSRQNPWLFFLCFIIVIGIMCSMICLYKKFRKAPSNYILLSFYTLAHSYLVAAVACRYEQDIVIAASVCTAGMFFALTLYACFTKTDMTKKGGFLSAGTMMVVLFLIMFSFFMSKIVYLVILCILVALLSLWIVYDTQLIIGGQHKATELDMDDYIIGALILYSDIVTMFMYILHIFGMCN